MRRFALLALLTLGSTLFAETNVVNGVTYVCEDGVCRMVTQTSQQQNDQWADDRVQVQSRIAQGYMNAEDFLAFLENRPHRDPFAEKGIWVIVLLVLLGGLALNLTPCVLPMIPVSLMIVGRSASRGTWYGLGIVLAYGTLGVLASAFGLAFGTIQAHPLFNLVVSLVFVALSLSLFGVFHIDGSKYRARLQGGAFFMGLVSAVLAGACVAPILISVLLLTAKLFAEGKLLALALPFVLGLGMALPWPFLGAGFSVLPKPGAWMKGVNRFFGVIVLGFAVWYGWNAVRGFGDKRESRGLAWTVSEFESRFSAFRRESDKPVLVDCWATWCKNCTAMEKETLSDPKVKEFLKAYRVIRLQVEDIGELRKLPGFGEVIGLPAFVVF